MGDHEPMARGDPRESLSRASSGLKLTLSLGRFTPAEQGVAPERDNRSGRTQVGWRGVPHRASPSAWAMPQPLRRDDQLVEQVADTGSRCRHVAGDAPFSE